MLKFLVLTSLAALVLMDELKTPSYNLLKGRKSLSVVGGEPAKPNDWPWQISIFQKIETDKYRHMCGGTLIGKRWVMTAAHCVDRVSAKELLVIAGEHDFHIVSAIEQFIKVDNIYIHHKWNMNVFTAGNDIALLRLKSDVTLTSNVELGSLPAAVKILPNTTYCVITGWGATYTLGRMSNLLMQAHLPLIDHDTCSNRNLWGSIVKKNMVCAGNGARSAYYGDSGGPLNCLINGKYYIYGVVSFGSKMYNLPRRPSIFTRVTAYIGWINSILMYA